MKFYNFIVFCKRILLFSPKMVSSKNPLSVTIDHFEYTWDSTRTILTLVCRAIGLPRAHVAIRADGFVVSDRQDAVSTLTERAIDH